jgi:selenocysteine lyase/cysteine desulfurase
MHEHGGYCFADCAASAPYVDIDMHPPDAAARLDAVFFSPHKFLGGPGAAGVLIFNANLYDLEVPDQPGGGTVDWTNPWCGRKYVEGIEEREDGGTPGFLQAIRAALAVRLKEQMGTQPIRLREEELRGAAFRGLRAIRGVNVLADHIEDRLCMFSFYVDRLHYNLIVKLLNDRFGIQSRGGCSCAGTYGHYLLHVDPAKSKRITDSTAAICRKSRAGCGCRCIPPPPTPSSPSSSRPSRRSPGTARRGAPTTTMIRRATSSAIAGPQTAVPPPAGSTFPSKTEPWPPGWGQTILPP